jgi:carboxypeptidase T
MKNKKTERKIAKKMTTPCLGLFLLGLLFNSSTHVQSADVRPTQWLVSLTLKNYSKEMRQLRQLDLDIAGVNLQDHQVDLIVTPEQAQKLESLGFRINKTNKTIGLIAPDSQYQNSTKIESALKQYAAAYSNLAQVMSIGKSLQGRDIWAMKITENPNQAHPERARIFFNSMHHAREVMTSEVGLDIVDQLLTQYGKDTAITEWVNHYEIWVIPMVNVDGNNLVWTQNSMWRKNARGGYGVDINRNYPYAWNSCNGSSSSQSSQDYHGPNAASEPETQVMMNFAKQIRPVFSISYHSYSEIVIYPYGCPGQRTETRDVIEPIGKELASRLVSDNGTGRYKPGTAPELLYAVDGGDIDWLYHEAHAIPYVIEVNSSRQGFQPSYSAWRDISVKRQRAGWRYLFDRMSGPSLHGQAVRNDGRPMANATLKILSSGFSQSIPADRNGYFHVILKSGNYQVTVQAPGFQPQTKSVVIGPTPVGLDFTL